MSQTPILTPSLAEVIVSAIESRIADLHTGLPATVISFNAADGTCVVQPLLLRFIIDENGDEQEEKLPQITNVPVHYPGGGGWFLIFPLKADDIVFLSFIERSIDTWMEAVAGADVDPIHTRKHDLSDAICIPSMRPRTKPITDLASLGDNCRLGFEGGDPAIVLKLDGTIEIGEGGTESLILGDILVTAIQSLTVPTAFGPSGPPINAAAYEAAKSAKGKVK